MSLLDDIISDSGVGGGPRIISEVNDLGQIAVEDQAIQNALRGLTGARGWDAREYGISAEQAAQMLRDADTPENRERVIKQLRELAVRRAGLDTTNGKVAVMVAGEAAWHRLGVNVVAAVSSGDAIKLAGLD